MKTINETCMPNTMSNEQWLIVLYSDGEKITSRMLTMGHDEAEIEAQNWVDVRYKGHDWSLHRIDSPVFTSHK